MADRQPFVVKEGGGGEVLPSLPGVGRVDLPTFRIPRIDIPVSSFEQQIEFLDVLGKAGDFLNKSVDGALNEIAAADGATEGTRVGAEGTFERRSPISISGRAFNQANLNAYADTVQLRLRDKIEETALANPADPLAFEQTLESWRQGFQQELPVELAGPFALQFQALARSEQAKIRATQRGLMQDEQAGKFALLEDRVIRNASAQAENLFAGDAEIAETALTALTANWAELDRHLAQTGPDGLPLFSPEVRAKKQLEFRDRVMVNGVRGWFRNTPDKAGALEMLLEGSAAVGKGNLAVKDQLPPEKFEALVGHLEADLHAEIALRNAQAKAARMAMSEARKANDLALAVGVAEGSIGRNEIIEAGRLGGVTAGSFRTLLEMASKPESQDDPAMVLQTRDEIGRGVATRETVMSRVGAGLSHKTAGELLEKFYGSGSSITDSPPFKRAESLITDSIKPTGPMGGFLEPDGPIRLNEALNELDERVTKGGEDPMAVARELVPRYRSNPITSDAFPRPKLVPLDPRNPDLKLEDIDAARAKIVELVRSKQASQADAERDLQNLGSLRDVVSRQLATEAELDRLKAIQTPKR